MSFHHIWFIAHHNSPISPPSLVASPLRVLPEENIFNSASPYSHSHIFIYCFSTENNSRIDHEWMICSPYNIFQKPTTTTTTKTMPTHQEGIKKVFKLLHNFSEKSLKQWGSPFSSSHSASGMEIYKSSSKAERVDEEREKENEKVDS